MLVAARGRETFFARQLEKIGQSEFRPLSLSARHPRESRDDTRSRFIPQPLY
jgi:hypothetical protein